MEIRQHFIFPNLMSLFNVSATYSPPIMIYLPVLLTNAHIALRPGTNMGVSFL